MINIKSAKTLQRTRNKIKAFIIAFAAVVTAAYAPQTGPFQRFLAPEPTIPIEDPVTEQELAEICPDPSAIVPPSEDTVERGNSDRKPRPLFKRFRSRKSDVERRRHSPRRRFAFFLSLRKGDLKIGARRDRTAH